MIDRIAYALKSIIAGNQAHLKFIVITIICIIVFLFILFIWAILKARKASRIQPIHTVKIEPTSPPPCAPSDLENDDKFKLPPFLYGLSEPFQRYFKGGSFSRIFFQAQRFIEKSFQDKYSLPWFVVLGAANSGKTKFVDSLENNLHALSPDFDQIKPHEHCYFSFFNDAVVLNLKGNFFLNQTNEKNNPQGFRTLLLLLSRYRMNRPLNGIMLTIPMTEIYGIEKLSLNDIQKRALAIKEKLGILQDFLGIRLPVYVFFTKTDIVDGFEDFVETLTPEEYNSSMGWSVEQFSKRELEEAFLGLNTKLQKIMTRIFTTLDDEQKSGKIFTFINDLIDSKERLSHYLTNIFSTEAYHTSPMFRGFYFVGAPHEAGVLFAKDIVQEKVFQEKGLVYPLINLIKDRRAIFKKTQVGVGLTAIVLSVGFWRAKNRFELQKENIKPVLYEFVNLANQMQLTQQNDIQKLKYISEETLRNLTKLAEVTSKRTMFFSMFIPATWFSPYLSHLKITIHKIVQILIVGSLYANLVQKSRQLMSLEPTKDHQSDNFGALLFPLYSKEFGLLRYYVSELKELTKHIQEYNYLGETTALHDFDSIYMYCFGEPLPETFKANFHRINKFLGHKDLPKIDLRPYQEQYRKVLGLLLQSFYNSLFDHTNLKSLVSRLKNLERNFDPLNTDLTMTIEELRNASIILSENLENIKDRKDLWPDLSYFDPGYEQGDAFAKLIKDIQEHYLFGDQIAHIILNNLNQGFLELKKSLQKFNKFLHPDLADEEVAKKRASEGIFIIEKALRFLKNMPLMDISKTPIYRGIKTDEIMTWDVFPVDQIIDKISAIPDFKTTPSVLVPKLKAIFNQSMRGFVLNTLMNAYIKEQMLTDDTPATEIESYLRDKKATIKKFEIEWVRILTFMKKENVEFAFFKEQLGKTAIYFLTLIDQLLESDQLYASKGFKFWDGHEGSTKEAFGSTNKEVLDKYLEAQFNRVKFLSGMAEPLIIFLNSEPMEEEENNKDLIIKWERITRMVSQREKGQNADTLEEFENFVKTDMNKLTAYKAFETFEGHEIESQDYFKHRLSKLQHMMLEKAKEILRRESIQKYNQLYKFFKDHLQNKFPFSKDIRNEVALHEVKAFFDLYDKLGGSPEKILVDVEFIKNAGEAMKWIKSIHQLREFFASFIDGKTSVPEIQIEWEFRVNREKEQNGSHVMDFTFKPNEEKEMVFIKKEQKYSRWVLGDKIQIGFEWTEGANKKDFPMPTSDAAQKFLRVSGKKAVFVYDNPWSLFTLLRMHHTVGTILKFEVPQDNGDKFVGYNNIRFIKAGLTPKDPKEYIELGEIPTEAPTLVEMSEIELEREQSEESHERKLEKGEGNIN